MPLEWTNHALEMAARRYPGVDLEDKYNQKDTRAPGTKTRRKLKKNNPVSSRLYHKGRDIGRSRYWRITKCGIVFVLAPPEVVVSVFPLEWDDNLA